MPGLDLCAAGLCRKGRALLPEKRNQAAAAQGRVYLGRGEVRATNRLHRHCEERSDEAIQFSAWRSWIASRSLSSGAHSRDPLARNDETATIIALQGLRSASSRRRVQCTDVKNRAP